MSAARRLTCNVAVVGAGPAGVAAAVSAGAAGARVILLDENTKPGGQVWRHTGRPPRRARRWLDRLEQARAAGRLALLERSNVIDIEAGRPHLLLAQRHNGGAVIAADAVVLATGARERFVPFPGWTLPGVFGVGGAHALLASGLDVRGRRCVVAGSGPLLLPVAASLAAAGAHVIEVAEQASAAAVARFAGGLWRSPLRLARAAAYRVAFRSAGYRTGTWIARASGGERVSAVVLTDGRRSRTLRCDMLCAAYGLVPAVELAALAGCVTGSGSVIVDVWQRTSVAGILAAGEPTGIGGEEAALVEGEIAGLAAAGVEPTAALTGRRDVHRAFALRLEQTFGLRDEMRAAVSADTVVCRCEDVTHARLQACDSARAARLLTRAGMGPCQARVCGPAMQYLYGWEPPGVRAPVCPATVATLIDTLTSTARSD
jgi:D-hydroxyproline dehydrogenase subunit alpha